MTPLSSISGPDGHISAVFSEAFDDIRDKFSILRGLDGMDIAGNGHGSSMAMTGGGSYPGRIGYGYSIDAVMSESRTFYPEVPFLKALRTSVGEEYPASFSFTSSSGTLARLPSHSFAGSNCWIRYQYNHLDSMYNFCLNFNSFCW